VPYWDSVETLKREELEKLQLKLLRYTLKHAINRSTYYANRLPNACEDLHSIKDIEKLPTISKEDIRLDQESFPPLGKMICVPEDDIVYISSSSGSTGNPTASPFTKQDFDEWIDYEARLFYSSGLMKNDRYCHALNFSLFVGGPCVLGAQRVGALSIHAGTIASERLIKIIDQYKPTVIWTTPSYAWYLGETAAKMGFEPTSSSIKKLFVAGEPGGSIDNTRRRIEELWDAKVYDYYGISDVFGACAGECTEQAGLHVAEDHILVEVIDRETGEHAAEGEKGEMYITTLKKMARPLIRFRTGDIVTYELDKCTCGRTHKRLIGVHGRVDDMLIIKGVNVMPSAIEAIVRANKDLTGEYRLIVTRENHLDALTIETEHVKNFKGNLLNLELRIQTEIKAALGVAPRVVVYSEDTLPRATHKAKRIIDKREHIWNE